MRKRGYVPIDDDVAPPTTAQRLRSRGYVPIEPDPPTPPTGAPPSGQSLRAGPFGSVFSQPASAATVAPPVERGRGPIDSTEAPATPTPPSPRFRARLASLLTSQEGLSAKIYKDSGGFAFGKGHFIRPDDPEHGMPIGTEVSQARQDAAFEEDLDRAIDGARAVFPGFDRLPGRAKDVLGSMTFQMGPLEDWPGLVDAVSRGDWRAAAHEMLVNAEGDGPSEWAEQTPGRAKKMAREMGSLAEGGDGRVRGIGELVGAEAEGGFSFGNVVRGAGERATDLGAGFLDAVGTLADFMEKQVPLGGIEVDGRGVAVG